VEILWGHPPAGRTELRLGTPDRGARRGGETHGEHGSRGAIGLQWAQPLGRPTAAGGGSAASPRRGAWATRPAVAHARALHTADGPRGIARAQRPGREGGPSARAQYQGRGAQAEGLSAAPGGAGDAPKEESSARRQLRQEQKPDAQARSAGRVNRVRLAGTATVHLGAWSRGGLTRGDHQASEHERGGKEKDVPCGSVEEERAEPTIPFGSSDKTSDCIVEALAATWTAVADQEKAATSRLQLTMDHGPESRGRRTPLLQRLGPLADDRHQPMQLRSSPPYHRKSQPMERCWGLVEWQGKGTKVIDGETMREWAKRRTWKGIQPVVARSRKGYQKGIALGKAALQAVEARLARHPALPTYDILSHPAATS
jgi:Rhodopirellula transposase DDE domain